MKKYVIMLQAIVMCLAVSSIAHAKEKIVFHHMFSKDAVSLPQSQLMADAINQNFNVDFKPGIGCSTKAQIDQEKDSVLVEFVTGRYWKSLQEKDRQCDIDLTNFKILATQSYFTNMCVLANGPIISHNDLINKKNLKIGYSTGSHYGFWIDQFVSKYGTDTKKIPYTNSNKQVLALLAGEIDVVTILDDVADKFVGDGQFRCVSYGDPKHQLATEKLFNKMSPVLSSAPNLFVLAVKNVSEKQYQDLAMSLLSAKRELDKKFPSNRLKIMGANYTEIEAESAIKSGTVELFKLTHKM